MTRVPRLTRTVTDLSQDYYDKWHAAVRAECAAELVQVRERIQTWPLPRLVREGTCSSHVRH
jgi:hypothetical protein